MTDEFVDKVIPEIESYVSKHAEGEAAEKIRRDLGLKSCKKVKKEKKVVAETVAAEEPSKAKKPRKKSEKKKVPITAPVTAGKGSEEAKKRMAYVRSFRKQKNLEASNASTSNASIPSTSMDN